MAGIGEAGKSPNSATTVTATRRGRATARMNGFIDDSGPNCSSCQLTLTILVSAQ